MANYNALLETIFQPLLSQPEAFRFDVERNSQGDRYWVRISFADADRGRVYGKSGRTIQAIRAVFATAAQVSGQQFYLDVYDPTPPEPEYTAPSPSEEFRPRRSGPPLRPPVRRNAQQ
ncbi:MAG: KH domain-containing protein [Pseudanabaenaceae cyanobacterium]